MTLKKKKLSFIIVKGIYWLTFFSLQFQMYGRYTKELGEFAKEEAKKLNKRRKDRLQADELRNKYRGRCATKFATVVGFIWKHTFAKLGEDWVFLALLGIIMATISFFMDRGINIIGRSKWRLDHRTWGFVVESTMR